MNFLKAYYDKLSESDERMSDVAKEVSANAVSLTKSVLLECEGNSIEIDDECNTVTVQYDGGRHPEYDSNCFSSVYRVYLEDGNILYECEDADRLRFSDLIAYEQASVAYAVYYQYLANKE